MKRKVTFLSILWLFVGCFFFKMHFTSALNLSVTHSGYYFERVKADGDYFSWDLNYYTIDNQVAYCIEPDVYEGQALVEGSWSNTHLSNQVKQEVLLTAYYGYTYSNHKTDKYRAATQALIWEAILGEGTEINYTSERFGYGNTYDVSKEKREIKNLIRHHDDKPSFAGTTLTVQVEKPIELVDKNNVLSNFEIISTGNALVEVNNNTLKITPTQTGEMVLSFRKKKDYSSSYRIFYGNGVQNMMIPGNMEDVTFQIQVTAIYGEITLTKYDVETKIAQGDATLEGAQYEVYRKSDDVLVSFIQTDKDGNASTGRFFPYGEFYIKEVKSSEGYELDLNTYYAIFDDSGNIHLDVPEKVIKGRIQIVKVDSESEACSPGGDAKLTGARYGIYNSKNILVDTLIIGEDCRAISKELPYGNYTVRELFASEGYHLDEKEYVVSVHSANAENIVSKEEVIKGKIALTKVDSETKICEAQGNATLVGAQYGIYNSKGVLVDILTINADCIAISSDLPYGEYTIKELEASMGYKRNETIYKVQIYSDGTQSIQVEEDVMKGKIQIIKKDKDTKSFISLGQAQLVGAKYGIYNQTGSLIEVLTINNRFEAISSELPYGNYTIKELEPSNGYELDTTIYSVFLNEEKMFVVISEEPIIKNKISILKQAEYIEGNSGFLSAEVGIVFEIYHLDGSVYESVTTDQNGYAIFELPYGVWNLHQKNSSPGFEKIPDFSITVNHDSEKEQYYNILNNKVAAYLQIYKIDAETKKGIALADTTFKIWDKSANDYVKQYVGGNYYSEFKTDDMGRAMTYLKLKTGNYKLIEVQSPKGYLTCLEEMDFEIGEETEYTVTELGLVATIYFENQPIKGQVKIQKKGEYFEMGDTTHFFTTIPLEHVQYGIYAEEDIVSSDGKNIYYKKGELVDILITDKEGYAFSKLLPLGKYHLKEIETKENYILDEKVYSFAVVEQDSKTPIVYVFYDFENALKKGKLELTKVDRKSGEGISNTQFQLFTEEGKLLFTGVTEENGILQVFDLPIGRYYIEESTAALGYLLSNERKYFEIKENEEVIKILIENKKISSTVTIYKVNQDSIPMEGVEIGIYKLDGTPVYIGTTNQEGVLQVDLEYGEYYYQEIQTLSSYLLDDQKHYFSVQTEEGQAFTLMNEKEEVLIPNTFKNENYILEMLTFFFALFTLRGIYVKR